MAAPETSREFLSRAQQYFDDRQFEAALIEAKNALQEDGENAAARLLLARIHLALGQGRAAEIEFQRAGELGADPDSVLVGVGRAQLLQRRYRELLQSLPASGQPQTIKADVLVLRGQAFLALARPQAAAAAFRGAEELEPDNSEAILGRASAEISLHGYARALALATSVTARAPDNAEAWFLRGEAQRHLGDWNAAVTAYDTALDLSPRHFAARLNRAAVRMNAGHGDDAYDDVEQLAERAPQNVQVIYLKAVLLAQRNDIDGSRSELDKASAILTKTSDEELDRSPQALLLGGAIETARGNWESAARYLEGFLKRSVDSDEARLMLAEAYIRTDQVPKAIATLQSIAHLHFDDPQFLVLMGRAHTRAGDHAQAKQHFERAAKLAPENARISGYLGITKLKIGGIEAGGAVADLRRAVDTDPDNLGPAIFLGLAHLQEGRFQEAYRLAEEMAKRHPDNPAFHNLAGSALLANGAAAAARVAFSEALKRDPRYLPARYNLANLALAERSLEEAKKHFLGVLNVDPEQGKAVRRLSQIAEAEGNGGRAIELLEDLWSKRPDDSDIPADLVGLYQRTGNHRGAIEIARQFVAHSEESPRALELLGRAQLGAGFPDKARDTFSRLAKQVADSPDALFAVARLQQAAGDEAGSEKSQTRALALDPLHEPTHSARVNALLSKGDDQAARHEAEKLVVQHPDAAIGYLLRGDVLMWQGAYDDAEWAYTRAMSGRQDWPVLRRLYKVQKALGKDTTDLLELWCRDRPERRDCFMLLAASYLSAGDAASAAHNYRRLLNRRPNDPILLNNLAGALHRQEDPGAADMARRALALAPENPAIMDTLGWILAEGDGLDEGLGLLREAHARLPNNPEVAFHLGAALLRAERREEGEALLRQAIDASPDSDLAAAAAARLARH